MQPVNPDTFELKIDDEELLVSGELAVELLSSDQFGFNNWAPWVPNPPPLTVDRLGGTFIPRAPVRLTQAPGQGTTSSQGPLKQDPRMTRMTETVAMVINALVRNGDIYRSGGQDFAISYVIPQVAGVDAQIGQLFYDTTTDLVSWKDDNGVVIPVGTGVDGGGP